MKLLVIITTQVIQLSTPYSGESKYVLRVVEMTEPM
jgi:hypothetical protein